MEKRTAAARNRRSIRIFLRPAAADIVRSCGGTLEKIIDVVGNGARELGGNRGEAVMGMFVVGMHRLPQSIVIFSRRQG